MTWVSWRLQRTETLIAVGILALLAALLVPTGIQMANAYHQDGLAACLSINPSKPVLCGNELGNFQQRFQSLTTLANWFTLIPGLIGVLLAAPFIFDLENGTYRLAWTQSITRGRWLLGKLGLPVVTALLAAGALTLLFTWWRTPNVHINGRLDTGNYDTTGTVVIGYTLFALALALALGAIWRRAAASLTVAFVGYFAVRIFVDYALRDHLVAPLTGDLQGRPAAELPLQRTRHQLQRHHQRQTDHEHARRRRLPRRPCTGGSTRDQQGRLPRRLPTRKPLLAAPTHRNRPLRRHRHRADPLRRLVDTPTHGLNTATWIEPVNHIRRLHSSFRPLSQGWPATSSRPVQFAIVSFLVQHAAA